jgi:hypothetical protein
MTRALAVHLIYAGMRQMESGKDTAMCSPLATIKGAAAGVVAALAIPAAAQFVRAGLVKHVDPTGTAATVTEICATGFPPTPAITP